MFEPNVIVLYVENPAASGKFYEELLGLESGECSPTFHSFSLPNGMSLGLKSKQVVEATPENAGNGELAMTMNSREEVDELFAKWQAMGLEIITSPCSKPYGYTLLATDVDGNRLRAVFLEQA